MSSIALFLTATTFFSTLAGGFLAIRFKDHLHHIMAFTAGVLLGVVSFDIFPELIERVNEDGIPSIHVMTAFVGGFLLFHVLEKVFLIHHAHESHYATHRHPDVGVFSALALIGHSLLDGIGIGLGFQADPSLGILVAVAVISHNFTDGMNTATFMLHHGNTHKKSVAFLILDALAPVLGVLSTLWFTLPETVLIPYLGFFAGFLLYIGASDILPEAHSKKSSFSLIGLTVFGTIFIFVITRIA